MTDCCRKTWRSLLRDVQTYGRRWWRKKKREKTKQNKRSPLLSPRHPWPPSKVRTILRAHTYTYSHTHTHTGLDQRPDLQTCLALCAVRYVSMQSGWFVCTSSVHTRRTTRGLLKGLYRVVRACNKLAHVHARPLPCCVMSTGTWLLHNVHTQHRDLFLSPIQPSNSVPFSLSRC